MLQVNTCKCRECKGKDCQCDNCPEKGNCDYERVDLCRWVEIGGKKA